MKAIVNVVCYKSKTLKNGNHPLMVRISMRGKRIMKSLGVSINPAYWDYQRNAPKRNCPNREEISVIITNTIAKYNQIILEKESKGENYTLESLVLDDTKNTPQESINKFLEDYIKELRNINKIGSSYAYLNLKTTLSNFYTNIDSLSFTMIDYTFCHKFELWMRSNNFKDTTISYYFRTLRSTFNKAIESKIVNRNSSPFNEFKLNRFSKKTKKRALSKDNITKILNMDCSSMSPTTQLAHDIFCFSYYCGGISLVDIANLTPENIIDNRLVYNRQKTHGGINLMLLDEAKKIIAKYSNYQKEGYYLFPILNNKVHITEMQKYNRERKLCYKLNRELKAIAKSLGIAETVTTYVARHSFATVLKKSGVNIGIISQALGHQDIKTTEIYLSQFDNEDIDKAMKNLL